MVFPIVPPSVSELGNSTGFDIQMEDRGNLGHAGLIQARNMLLGMAAQDPKLVGVRPASLEDTAQLHLDVDQAKADALGLSLLDVNATLSTAWGGSFVNNFVDRGRIKRVYIQGDAPYRDTPGRSGAVVCARQQRRRWRRFPPSPPRTGRKGRRC